MKPYWIVFGSEIKKEIKPDKNYLFVVAASADALPPGKIIKRKATGRGDGSQFYLLERKEKRA